MFAWARNFALGDAGMSKLLYDGTLATFLEDAAMVEAVQTNREGGSLEGLVHVGADGAQLQARRILQTLIEDERRAIAAE
jgi:hypothetical protein